MSGDKEEEEPSPTKLKLCVRHCLLVKAFYEKLARSSSSPTFSSSTLSTSSRRRSPFCSMDRVTKLASQREVVIFSMSSCCMCHTVTRLFRELGVNPTVVELDEDPRGKEMEKALARLLGRSPAVPAVFIGGRLVGSTDKVMSLHLGGNLVPLLRNAGALWV